MISQPTSDMTARWLQSRAPVRELSWFTIFYNYGSRWLQHVTTIVGVLNQPLGPLGTSYKVKRGVHLEGGFPVDQAYGFSPQ
jgi:hypothetical protein